MNESQVKKELEEVLATAREKGNVTMDGIFVMHELKKRGWISKSYAALGHSLTSYRCGYSGCYSGCLLVKGASRYEL